MFLRQYLCNMFKQVGPWMYGVIYMVCEGSGRRCKDLGRVVYSRESLTFKHSQICINATTCLALHHVGTCELHYGILRAANSFDM